MPIFGITASSNMSTKLTDFYQIATTTLATSAANIEFTSIPQDYTHLQIRGIARNSTAGTSGDWVRCQFNSDTSASYSWHYLYGSGTGSPSSGAGATQSFMLVGWTMQNTSTANSFGVTIVDILDYKNTNKYKTVRSNLGYNQNTTDGGAGLNSGNWRSTSAITSIKLYPASGNFNQYSSFQLYGVKS
jgi:hypothetical protein